MKAFEFNATVADEGWLQLPQDVAVQIQPQQDLRVIVLVQESSEDTDWARLTLEEFAKDDYPADAIYDDLPKG
jgi:hypothetical protein